MQADKPLKIPRLKFTLQDERVVDTKDLKGQWWVVFFYPKDSTPGCTIENIDFSALRPKFEKLGARVFGCSRDSVRSHQNFCAKQNLELDLISDPDETVCRAFDVIREKNMYGRKVIGIERSTFIVGPDAVVRAEWRKVKVKEHAEAVLQSLRSLTR
ncbi:MAG: peroxiredoxin [Xanthomonadales bacterium]|nr:peroxiredoxin [Xanthomonadales bacterium]